MSARRAVFLDRDGVLAEAIVRNGRAYAPTRLEDFRLVPDAADQIARLRSAGLPCLVFTNQPEVASGLLSQDTLDAMHADLRLRLQVDEIYVCAHDPQAGCECHKPRPGMLLAGAREWDVDLRASFVIGDRWRDIEAGNAVGAFSILLGRPYSACTTYDAIVTNLSAAVDLVLQRIGTE